MTFGGEASSTSGQYPVGCDGVTAVLLWGRLDPLTLCFTFHATCLRLTLRPIVLCLRLLSSLCAAVYCFAGLRSGDQSAPNNTSLLRHADLSSPPAASAAAAAADAGLHQPQQQQQRRLLPTSSCPYWGAVGSLSGGGAGGTNAPDANVSGECVISQPVDTSAVFSSSTMQLLSGCHSAPHPRAALRQAQQVQLLQRACGCTGDEECEECEGVQVTLSSASNLPLVTTPGPRPKPLTLEDLHLTGETEGQGGGGGKRGSSLWSGIRVDVESTLHTCTCMHGTHVYHMWTHANLRQHAWAR